MFFFAKQIMTNAPVIRVWMEEHVLMAKENLHAPVLAHTWGRHAKVGLAIVMIKKSINTIERFHLRGQPLTWEKISNPIGFKKELRSEQIDLNTR